jgi:hypothetical protein
MQFRPRAHRLNLQVTRAARGIYGQMAPETMYLGIVPGSGLLVYSMKRMEGISYRDFISCDLSLPLAQSTPHRATLCKDFALFLARSWYSRNAECLPVGQIGGSIRHRLASLCRDLPSRFQPTAQGLLERLPQIESLPWVLTHGDIVQSNIIVDPASGTLAGLVDWAEAEILPFGVCLYGLEEILGKMTVSGFRYQPDAGELRDLFWVELANLIPALRQADTLESVKLARDLGVLLWHGIAFDNGAINRVVQEGRDINEIYRLDAFMKESILCRTSAVVTGSSGPCDDHRNFSSVSLSL